MAGLDDLTLTEVNQLIAAKKTAKATGPVNFEEDSFLEVSKRAVTDLPSTLYNAPKALGQLGLDFATMQMFGPGLLAEKVTGIDNPFIPEFASEAAPRAIKGGSILGGAALGTAGGLLVGGPAGGFVGGGLGAETGDVLSDLILGEELPSAAGLGKQTTYDFIQDLLTLGLGKSLKQGTRTGLMLADDIAKGSKLATKKGRDVLTARTLSSEMEAAGITLEMIEDLSTDPALEFQSLAERFDSEGLARSEGALDRGFKESAGVDAATRRQLRSESNVGKLEGVIEDTNVTAESTGAKIFDELEAAKEARFKEVSKLYEALDGTQIVDGGEKLVTKIEKAFDKHISTKDPGKLDPTIEKMMFDIVDSNGVLDLHTLDIYKRALSDVAFSQSATSTNKLMAKAILDGLKDAEKTSGGTLGKASAVRAKVGIEFEQGAPGQILKRKKYKERAMLNSQIPNKILANSDNAGKFGAIATIEAKQALVDFIASDLQKSIDTPKQGGRAGYWRKKDAALKKALTPEQYEQIDNVISDIESQARRRDLETAPSRGGSPTAQFEGDIKALRRKFGGDVAGFITDHPGLATVGGIMIGYASGFMATAGHMGSLIGSSFGGLIGAKILAAVKGLEGDVSRKLYRALTNKKEAIRLMKLADGGSTKAKALLDKLDEVSRKVIDEAGLSAETIASRPVAELGREGKKQSRQEDLDSLTLEDINKLIEAKQNEVSNTNPTDNISSGSSGGGTVGAKKKSERPIVVREISLPDTVTEELLDAVREVESAGGKYLRSDKGAKGPYQLMDATGKRIFGYLGLSGEYDPFDEIQSRQIAKYHIEDGLRRFGRMDLALADYNAGHKQVKAAVDRDDDGSFESISGFLPLETALYVPKISKALGIKRKT